MSHARKSFAVKCAFAATMLMLLSAAAFADLKIQTRQNAMGHAIENTTYIKGARQRLENGVAGMGYRSITIYQCDLKRMITINDAAKTYTITLIDVDPPETAASTAPHHPASNSAKAQRDEMEDDDQPATKGGSQIFTMASIDTFERQQMFGFDARHVRTLMAMDSTEDACNNNEMMMEQDGWYIDLAYPFRCSVRNRPVVPSAHGEKPSCEDRHAMYTCYKGRRRGYPLKETTKIYNKDGKFMSFSQETVDLSKEVLDAKLFDIPSGYTEVKSGAEMGGGMTREQAMEMARQQQSSGGSSASSSNNSSNSSSNNGGLLAGGKWKKSSGENTTATAVATPAVPAKASGVVRVGVVGINNKSGQSASDMTSNLVDDIKMMSLDAVTLDGTGDQAVTDCKTKQCDYILYTDVSSLKPASTGKKIGGFFGRAIGQGEGSGSIDATVAYKLYAADGTTVKADASQTAREGTSADESLGAVLRRESGEVVKAIKNN